MIFYISDDMAHQRHPFGRALDSGQLTDAASTLVGSYTAKLNSVNTSGVIRQAAYMMAAAGAGLLLYLIFLRPQFGVRRQFGNEEMVLKVYP